MLAELAQILSYNSLSVYTLQFTFSCNSLVLDPGLFVCLAGYKCMSKNASNKLKSSQTNHTYPSLEHFVLAKNMIKCYIIEEVVDRILGGLGGIFPKKPKNFKIEIAILRKKKIGHNVMERCSQILANQLFFSESFWYFWAVFVNIPPSFLPNSFIIQYVMFSLISISRPGFLAYIVVSKCVTYTTLYHSWM